MAGSLQITWQTGRFRRWRFLVGDRTIACLNPGGTEPDFFLLRPSLHPVYSPRGVPLTEQGAHNYPHHKGVWIGHGRVNGVNCFSDAPGSGRIETIAAQPAIRDGRLWLDLELCWVDGAGTPLLTEERRLAILPDVLEGWMHLIEIESVLIAERGPVVLASDKHAYCGVRVLDALDEDDGGILRNSHGQRGAETLMGVVADWVDCSGRVGTQGAGITLMRHPQSPPAPFFTRAYGTVLCNYFYDRSLELPVGGRFRQHFAVATHDGDATTFDPARAYAFFVREAALRRQDT
jgi:hypothetical protein